MYKPVLVHLEVGGILGGARVVVAEQRALMTVSGGVILDRNRIEVQGQKGAGDRARGDLDLENEAVVGRHLCSWVGL